MSRHGKPDVEQSAFPFTFRHGELATALGLSTLLKAVAALQLCLIAMALAFDIALHNYFLIIPLSLLVMAAPVSVNAIGIRARIRS